MAFQHYLNVSHELQEDNPWRDPVADNALYASCKYGQISLVRQIISRHEHALKIICSSQKCDIVDNIINYYSDLVSMEQLDDPQCWDIYEIVQLIIPIYNQTIDRYGSIIQKVDFDISLNRACEKGNKPLAELFLQYGANPNHGLRGACSGGHMDIIWIMIHAGADDRPLYEACKGGYHKIAKFLIWQGARDYDSGLHGACIGGHLEIAKLMIKRGASITRKSMSSAVKSGNLALVEYLLPNYTGTLSNMLEYACSAGHVAIVNLLISKKVSSANGLVEACRNAHWDIARIMFEYNPSNINTALTYAVGNIDMMMLLMESADDWDAAFGKACLIGNREMINTLIGHKSINYRTGLRNACFGEHIDLVRFFLEHISYIADMGLLYVASARCNTVILQMLISRGANDFNDAMHVACSMGYMDIIILLLPYCDVRIIDNAIHISAGYGHLDIVKVLLPRCTNIVDVFEYACVNRKINIVEYLLPMVSYVPHHIDNIDNIYIYALLCKRFPGLSLHVLLDFM